MSARAGATNTHYSSQRARWLRAACTAWVLALCACSPGYETEPLVEYSTEVVVEGTRAQTVRRPLSAGIYVVEVRERDIDLKVAVESDGQRSLLDDAVARHGVHRMVVRLNAAADLRVTVESKDQRSWKGAAGLRLLRWPKRDADSPPDERLLGFAALGTAGALVGRKDVQSWRAALTPLREAERHFRAARDLRLLAETEYQRGWIEFDLLYQFEDGRRTAVDAISHYRAVRDQDGMHRASVLLALNEFNISDQMGPEVPRSEYRALLDTAVNRTLEAKAWFEAREMETDALSALAISRIRETQLGHPEQNVPAWEEIRRRAKARGDRYNEGGATSALAYAAMDMGDMARAAELFEQVLPLTDRDRDADFHATILANFGGALNALGDFDRALAMHTEALEVFSERGDLAQTARELGSLAAIQFRTGNVERALATIENALPVYEKARDVRGLVRALHLAGNAASALGDHRRALDYLRRAESGDPDAGDLIHTQVLIAGELRELGELSSSDELLDRILLSADEVTRADALVERARLRLAQRRQRSALGDLREADAIYERLNLDFNRIDTSSALAMVLLSAGDRAGAARAADTAVSIEQRIRVKSANPETRARFLAASYAPYEARIEVDLAGAPQDTLAAWRAFRTADAIRARSLADRLAHARSGGPAAPESEVDRLRETLTALQVDLERRMRSGSVGDDELLEVRRRIDASRARLEVRLVHDSGIRASQPMTIGESPGEVQKKLPADTAVLAYFVGDSRSHAWLLTAGELRHEVLPGRRVLEAAVRDFVARQRSGVAPDAQSAAPFLGSLLGGVGARRLLVLPDGPLNSLPFAALPMSRARPKEMLVDRFVVNVAPSLAMALQPKPGSTAGGVARVAVISDPVYSAEDRRLTMASNDASKYRGAESDDRGFSRLPYSAIEARAVARAFAGADVIQLAGFDATASRVAALQSRDLDVLHFATHAVPRRDAPEQSALFLTEYAADGSALRRDRLTADDITRTGLRADVVVLSGCATGDGRELRGEGVLGLTYGFLATGSHTVVASLWPVEDALTARFMEEFYAAYRTTGRATEALRTAQLRTRGTAAAAVWASFVVRSNGMP
jgi:tetratricopeptide (TPR) repeat protein